MSGTATNGSDYTTISGPISIPAGSSYRDITLTPINDNEWEPNETAILTLSTNSAYVIGKPNSATITISDDDLPTVTVTAPDASAGEASRVPNTGTYRISRTGSTSSSLNVYFTMSGTATNGSDYTTISSPISIPAGSSYRDITLTPINNSVWEPNETATLTISTNSAYVIGKPNSATITISDDDIPTVISVTISGPTQVDENTETPYTLTALWSDKSSTTVTSSAGWSEDSYDYASISSTGYLTTYEVPSDQLVTITATYGGKSDAHSVTIKDVSPAYVVITGPTQVNESSGEQYTLWAYYSNPITPVPIGINVTNNANWSENSSYASISSGGYLTTSAVSSDQLCTITASYRGKVDTHSVTIKDTSPTVTVEAIVDSSM